MEVKIVADSISPQGVRITTFELNYPRFIHAELMTHRMFSRNAQSSRAVPVKKATSLLSVKPLIWGKNRPGMSSVEPLGPIKTFLVKMIWKHSLLQARLSSIVLGKIGLHKQWANRITEPFSNIKVVVTSTEWENFFNLRCNSNTVQPEFVVLANKMKEEMEQSVPDFLEIGEWHLPYVDVHYTPDGICSYVNGQPTSLEFAKMASVAACAQVSYRTLDLSPGKVKRIVEKLSDRSDPHLSPFEHQAMVPMLDAELEDMGITHMDKQGQLWSGNFRGWIQNRQLMEQETYVP